MQEKLKDLKSDLKREKDENRIMQHQLQEALKHVLQEGRDLKAFQAAFRQRDAEVAELQAELRLRVSPPALAPGGWSCDREAHWQTQTPSNPGSCSW